MAKIKPSTSTTGQADHRRVKRNRSDNDGLTILPLGASLAELKNDDDRTSIGAARYDANSSKFHQVVHVQHQNAFTLQTITVPDGALAGRQVVVLEPCQAFRFLDLPTEIRAMVYDLLYPETKDVVLNSYRRDPARLTTRLKHKYPGFHTALVKLDGEATAVHTLRIQKPIGFTLLRVSKQILREVAPLIYAKHRFLIHFEFLSNFMTSIGSMKKYVRHIHVRNPPHWDPHAGPQVVNAKTGPQCLDGATGLRTLILDQDLINPNKSLLAFYAPGSEISPSGDLEALVYSTLPLLTRIHSMNTSDNRRSVLDVVRIQAYHAKHCEKSGQLVAMATPTKGCKVRCWVPRRLACVVQPKLRAWLAERLGIDDTVVAKTVVLGG